MPNTPSDIPDTPDRQTTPEPLSQRIPGIIPDGQGGRAQVQVVILQADAQARLNALLKKSRDSGPLRDIKDIIGE